MCIYGSRPHITASFKVEYSLSLPYSPLNISQLLDFISTDRYNKICTIGLYVMQMLLFTIKIFSLGFDYSEVFSDLSYLVQNQDAVSCI
ncbi:hypothetical protein KFK09_014365 [Dendrobium nobile]|uniref:Uncharacterized protein n=1 Tax=Dendrobium nobile TaxID=94219 RepID=A0A8T3B9R0_DENNO|nr:hypothetical protein KFK09_014365 [Dendrobium nobile]